MRRITLSIILPAVFIVMLFSAKASHLEVEAYMPDEELFRTNMEKTLAIYNIPSLSACILKRDGNKVWQIAWKGAYGYRSAILPRFKADTDTIYTIASITKVITATAVMQLVDQGLISLDEDINVYMPFPIRNPGLDYSNPHDRIPPITVRHLLSHRSGLPSTSPTFFTQHRNLFKQDFGVFMSIDQLREYLAKKESWAHTPPDDPHGAAYYRPGESYCYCNVGYMILGFLIEAVINKDREPGSEKITWKDYIDDHILKPLNMGRTKFYWDYIWKFSNEAHGYIEKRYLTKPNPGYRLDPDGIFSPQYILVPQKNSIINPTLIGARYSAGGPAGQILSTPSDLAAFLIVHLNQGKGYVRDNEGNILYDEQKNPREIRILSEEGIEAMHNVEDERLCPVKPPNDPLYTTGLNRLTGYGLGWARGNLGGRYWNYPWNPDLDPEKGVNWHELAKHGINRNPIRQMNGMDTGGGLDIEGHSGDTYGYHSGMYRISDDLAIIYFINVDLSGEDRDESRMQPGRFKHYTNIANGAQELKGFDGALPHNIVKLSEIEYLLIQKAASLKTE